MNTGARLCLLGAAFLACAALLPGGVLADRNRDYEQALRAVERGEALSLVDILDRIRPQLDGEIVDVEFERKRGRWIYEFKVIDPGGRLWEIYVDAASAEVLKREGH